MLSAADAEFGRFGVWQDANSNGVSDAGEFRTLTEAGIVSVNLTSDGQASVAAGGDVDILGETVFTRADGSTGTVADIVLATGGADTAAKTAAVMPMPVAVNDDERAATTAAAQTGFASALVAAGLVAAVGFTDANEPAFALPGAANDAGGTIDLGPLTASLAAQSTQRIPLGETAELIGDAPSAFGARTASADHSALLIDPVDTHAKSLDLVGHDDAGSAMGGLLSGTDLAPASWSAPVHAGDDLSAMPVVAGQVHAVLADALHGTSAGAPGIDAVLDALAPQDANAALFTPLAETLGNGGGAGDMFAGLPFSMTDMTHDMAMAHIEAASVGHG
jgi:hypothetical protein